MTVGLVLDAQGRSIDFCQAVPRLSLPAPERGLSRFPAQRQSEPSSKFMGTVPDAQGQGQHRLGRFHVRTKVGFFAISVSRTSRYTNIHKYQY